MVGPNPGAILMFQSTESDGTPTPGDRVAFPVR